MNMRVVFAGAFALLCLTAVSAQRRGGGGASADALSFRFLGPVVGNRVASIAGVPGDPSIYYAGAASGGVWKTTDGGIRWAPVSDAMPVAAIGALAVAPSDPNIVWAGTGEAWAIRDSDVIGDGIYKSIDAGKTWTHMGLDETGRIGRILVHPTNPDIVFACAIGRITAPAAGARRLPHDRRRPALGARAVRRREHRLLRAVDGREESAHAVRRHVAGRDAPVGDVERRRRAAASTCRATAARKWTKVEAAGLPRVAARQDRRRRRADRFESRLRA